MDTLPLKNWKHLWRRIFFVAEGVRRYLNDKQAELPIISSRIPFQLRDPYWRLYWWSNTVELGRESVRTLLQIIKDNKENKKLFGASRQSHWTLSDYWTLE